MRIDAHVHMHGQEKDSGEFMKRLEMAGFDGAVVFSTAPDGMFGLGKTGTPKERLEKLMTYTKGRDTLYPFYFLDPTDEDALEQVKLAKEAGVCGYKIICNHFYPWNPQAMEVYRWIAEQHMPLMFHSGILYDGINASGKYNRPCEFEPLLSVAGLRFSVAHVSWPWTGECIAVYGKFNAFLKRNPGGKAAELFLDLTPGTPPTFRKPVLPDVYGNGFDVEQTTFWGSDNVAEGYNWEYAKRIRERDEEIFKELRLSEKIKESIFCENFMRFMNNN